MSAFLQTADGDLAITANSLSLVDGTVENDEGKVEVMQAIRSRLRVFRGECFLDQQAGTPWYQSILGKGRDLRAAESELREVVLSVPETLALLEFTFEVDQDTREASVTFRVSTTYGVITLTEGL